MQGFGDFGPDGSLVGENTAANSSHSVFLWQDDRKGKIYAVAVDNVELHDVDIFDMTDPRNPKPVAEHDLVELFPQIVDNSANENQIYAGGSLDAAGEPAFGATGENVEGTAVFDGWGTRTCTATRTGRRARSTPTPFLFSFGERGLRERGRFIDEGGNNFWGIEQFMTVRRKRERLIAASDRDFGLYLFRYTGPGAPHS